MAERDDKIKAALLALDPKNDEQWTSSGQPLVDTVRKLMSDETVTRQEITNADPSFSREVLLAALPGAQPPAAPGPVEKTGDGAPDVKELIAARAQEHEVVADEIAGLDKELHALKEVTADALRRFEQAQHKRDELIRKAEKLKLPAHVENTHSIQKYIATANAERAARAGVAMELRKVGITPLMLQAGSKLDQAMARKRGFGLSRPQMKAPAQA